MADDSPPVQRQMSLIPYPHDARDIVLRRGNAVVLYDSTSRELSVRDITNPPIELNECPYCHRPMRSRDSQADEAEHGRALAHERPFTAPGYWDLLAASQRPSPAGSGNSTPSRRLHPAIRSGRSRDTGAEFVASEPKPGIENGISASAFSPGYFKQFFREERELGRGGNGVVLLVEHVIDGVSLGHFACKRIPVGDSRSYFEKVIVEVRLLQKIPHKNLVAYHWTWLEDHQPSKFGPSVPCLWILQDYCNGGDLHSHVLGPKIDESTAQQLKQRLRRKSRDNWSPPQDLRGPSKLAFDEIFSFFRDIASGLHHLHSKGYIHRDLKPSNCLLQRDGGRTRVLISDFGEVQAANQKRTSSGATGTISYCAPEVLLRATDGSLGNFTTKSDIFSLGMIVYFMCFGRLPYANADDAHEENEDLEQLRAEITRWTGFNEEARVRPDLPERLYKYLKRLLSVDPNERPSTEEILASIKGNVSLGEPEHPLQDFSPRVSSVDSPAPRPSGRIRKYSQPRLPSTGRHNSGGHALSRSSTEHDTTQSRPLSPGEPSLALTSLEKTEKTPVTTEHTVPPESPRLMLPPPPPRPVARWIWERVHDSRTILSIRSLLFLAKLLSLSVPCSPYAPSQWLMYPLLLVAGLDLGPITFNLRQSLILLAAHMALVLTAYQHTRLCEAREVIRWDDS